MALQPLVKNYGGGAVCKNEDRDSRVRGLQLAKRGAEGEGIEQGKMEGDKELEEREMVEGQVYLADLDHLGYLDEMLEQVLGDFQKEFQGSLFTNKLRSTLGEYGSFLPTQVRGNAVLTAPSQAPAGVPRPPSLLEEIKLPVSGHGLIVVPDRAAKVSPIATGINGCHTQTNCVNHSGEDPNRAPPSFDDSSPDRSPNSMIQIFTTHVVPEGGLLSPLIEIYSKKDSGKTMRRDDIESQHQGKKSRVFCKPELKDCGAYRERLRELENRPGLGIYNEQATQQEGGSQLRSPPSSSSKVSRSAEFSALGTKGGSSIGLTVQEISEVLQNNYISHSQSSGRNAPSNRREAADYHKYDRIHGRHDDDHCWKEGREIRARSTNYYAEMGSKYRDELYRKRGQC